MIDADYVRSVLNYDPTTGIFVWSPNAHPPVAGKVAGTIEYNGYLVIRIKGKKYKNHRLAWLYMHGAWPKNLIGFIDGDKLNCRIDNLRDCTKQESNQNHRKAHKQNKLGILGVYRNKKGRPFAACIRLNNKCIHIGRYDTAEEAHNAYLKAKKKLHDGYMS